MAKKKERTKAPIYSMYCEVCKNYEKCGPQKVACEKFDPTVSIKITKKK